MPAHEPLDVLLVVAAEHRRADDHAIEGGERERTRELVAPHEGDGVPRGGERAPHLLRDLGRLAVTRAVQDEDTMGRHDPSLRVRVAESPRWSYPARTHAVLM